MYCVGCELWVMHESDAAAAGVTDAQIQNPSTTTTANTATTTSSSSSSAQSNNTKANQSSAQPQSQASSGKSIEELEVSS